jgi:hypothetical protein
MVQADNYETARTAEELATALGLSDLEAQAWKAQYALLQRLRQAISEGPATDADIASLARLLAASTSPKLSHPPRLHPDPQVHFHPRHRRHRH